MRTGGVQRSLLAAAPPARRERATSPVKPGSRRRRTAVRRCRARVRARAAAIPLCRRCDRALQTRRPPFEPLFPSRRHALRRFVRIIREPPAARRARHRLARPQRHGRRRARHTVRASRSGAIVGYPIDNAGASIVIEARRVSMRGVVCQRGASRVNGGCRASSSNCMRGHSRVF